MKHICTRCKRAVDDKQAGHVCIQGHSITITSPGNIIPNLVPKLEVKPIELSETERQCLEWLNTLPTMDRMIAQYGLPPELLGPPD